MSYDLGVPETHSDYARLSEHLKSLYITWARPVKSVWIVKSDKDAGAIRDEIKTVLDSNDKLIVVEVSGNWGTYNVDKEVTDWMKNNI
ncbi:MAG: hypothetical protein WCT36_05730 [Candidatus Gracilibacteria bacterium]